MTVALTPGMRLGPYEIVGAIGAGGMGEVYRARDTRLDRIVAIKVIASSMATPEGRSRFQLEARAIGALAHPNICALYDVGQQDEIDYLVMECLEGETLSRRLTRGPVPVAQALARAVEIAAALDAAHSRGVTHRDLKPANVFLTRVQTGAKGDGAHRASEQVVAKLLDFGLAKLVPPESAITDLRTIETHGPGTGVATIVGTLNYMSPEQAEGLAVDSRSDIFSFGALLYEMLTGRQAFAGRSATAILGAIVDRQAEPIAALAPNVPPAVQYAIDRCLAKSPDDRWQSARDLRAHLQHALTAAPPAAAPATPSAARAPWLIAGAMTLASIALAIALAAARSRTAPHQQIWSLSALPPAHGFGLAPEPALSPDGRRVAFAAPDGTGQTMLWVRALDSPAPKMLPGTESATGPFWSPDSRSIGVFSQGRLKTVDPSGGLPHVLADAPNPRGGTWSRNGDIVFVPNPSGGLFRVAAAGGTPSSLPTPGTSAGALLQGYPRFLPDGRRLLYFALNNDSAKSGIYVLDSQTSVSTLVSNIQSRAEFANGQLVFSRDASLFAQSFDPASGKLSGDPVRIVDEIGRSGGAPRFNYAFSVADDGTLAYWGGSTLPVTQLTWLDRVGRRIGTVGPQQVYNGVELSPDGRQIVVEHMDLRTTLTDIRVFDLNRASAPATTLISAADGQVVNTPLWSPDGKSMLYAQTATDLRLRDLVSGADKAVPTDSRGKWPTSWSPDGRYVVMDRTSNHGEIWTREMGGTNETAAYVKAAGYNADGAQISPDGRWIAYRSDETGEYEVYVDTFPKAGRKIRVSLAGGSRPQWRKDGRELFFVSRNGRLTAVGVNTASVQPIAGQPLELFEAPVVDILYYNHRTQYVAAADGQRFLFNAPVVDPARQGIAIGIGVVKSRK